MRGLFIRWMVLLAVAVAFTACDDKKKEEPKEEPKKESAKEDTADSKEVAETGEKDAPAKEPGEETPESKLLDAAIEARGGAEKVKAFKGVTCKSKGNYMGMPYTANNFWQVGGPSRMDVDMPGGQVMSMVFGVEKCWNQSGPVVVPCGEEAKANHKTMMGFDKAMALWPLKEEGWELKAEKAKAGDKEVDKLAIENADLGVDGYLLIDPESHLVISGGYQGKMMKTEGEFVFKLSDYKEACGIQLPHKTVTTFAGNFFMDEELQEPACDPIDQTVFDPPEQVADGTIVEKDTMPGTVACYTMKGPYTGMEEAFKKLNGYLEVSKLHPMGPPMMVYQKAPPKVKKPKKFVTDLCIPVAGPPPKKPRKKGKFVIKKMAPMHVLSVYGVGDYQKKSPELMKLLIQEAKKRKLKPVGPMGQVAYMKYGSVPAEEYVSEMMLPIKGTKVKKGMKGKKKKSK